MNIDVKPKVYSFPHNTRSLANRFDLRGLYVGIGVGVSVATSFIFFAFNNWFGAIVEKSLGWLILVVLGVIAIVVAGLFLGFITMLLGAVTTYSVLSSNYFFFKQKLGQQVQENFTNFIEWMRFNFNVDVSNLEIKSSKDKGAVWLVERDGDGTFYFKDTAGNLFSMSLVEGEKNEYFVSFVESAEEKSESPLKEETETDTIDKSSPFIQFFKAYGDSLSSDTRQIVTETISMVKALDESTLDAETSETVRLAKAELDTLSLLMLRTVPFGIDEDVEKQFLIGVKVLNETLTSVYDAYKKALKNKLSSRVKEVEFFFQQ